MRGVDGLELQRHQAPTHVSIISVTAAHDEAVREKALRARCGRLPEQTVRERRADQIARMALELPHRPEVLWPRQSRSRWARLPFVPNFGESFG